MRVINIIESVENVILGVQSYGIFEDQLSQDVIDVAEKDFTAKAIENGWNEDSDQPIESLIEEGVYENGDYSLYYIWSNI